MSDAWKTVGTKVVPVHIDGSPKDLPYVRPTPSPLDEEVEKAAMVASEFPKIHRCAVGPFHGRVIVIRDMEQFRRLPLACEPQTDAFCTMEHRNCECGGTLTIVTDIHDMGAR